MWYKEPAHAIYFKKTNKILKKKNKQKKIVSWNLWISIRKRTLENPL